VSRRDLGELPTLDNYNALRFRVRRLRMLTREDVVFLVCLPFWRRVERILRKRDGGRK
jgi:hypothetical protein